MEPDPAPVLPWAGGRGPGSSTAWDGPCDGHEPDSESENVPKKCARGSPETISGPGDSEMTFTVLPLQLVGGSPTTVGNLKLEPLHLRAPAARWACWFVSKLRAPAEPCTEDFCLPKCPPQRHCFFKPRLLKRNSFFPWVCLLKLSSTVNTPKGT